MKKEFENEKDLLKKRIERKNRRKKKDFEVIIDSCCKTLQDNKDKLNMIYKQSNGVLLQIKIVPEEPINLDIKTNFFVRKEEYKTYDKIEIKVRKDDK